MKRKRLLGPGPDGRVPGLEEARPGRGPGPEGSLAEARKRLLGPGPEALWDGPGPGTLGAIPGSLLWALFKKGFRRLVS